VRSVLTNHATLTQSSQQLGGPIEVRQLDVRGAHTLGIVRVGADSRRQLELLGEVDRRQVVVLIGDLCIEYFDDVQVALPGEGLEHRSPHASALRIEGVRGVHQSALDLYAMHHFGHRQYVRNALGQKQSDQLSRGRPNLFTDDDTHAKIASQRGLGRLDRVVVSNAHDIKPMRFDAFDELVQGRACIARSSSVQMTVKTNKAGRSGWRRPNSIQQQEGD
jgi:hypothetical protein